MTAIATHPTFRSDQSQSPTTPPEREDWWIDQSAGAEERNDTQSSERPIRSETEPPQASPRVRAIRKDDVYLSREGPIKTLLQQWECIVVGSDRETVQCEMHDLTDPANPVEYAELAIEEFNTYDRPHLTEGAVFYWSIGLLRKPTGQVQKYSQLRLRRMPKLSQTQRREIADKVAQLGQLCGDR